MRMIALLQVEDHISIADSSLLSRMPGVSAQLPHGFYPYFNALSPALRRCCSA
jgi:hypothetical protein